jgi:hypothetical protein
MLEMEFVCEEEVVNELDDDLEKELVKEKE